MMSTVEFLSSKADTNRFSKTLRKGLQVYLKRTSPWMFYFIRNFQRQSKIFAIPMPMLTSVPMPRFPNGPFILVWRVACRVLKIYFFWLFCKFRSYITDTFQRKILKHLWKGYRGKTWNLSSSGSQLIFLKMFSSDVLSVGQN